MPPVIGIAELKHQSSRDRAIRANIWLKYVFLGFYMYGVGSFGSLLVLMLSYGISVEPNLLVQYGF